MFVDYQFYTTVYLGNKLTESQFNKQAFKACNLITDETMTRVTDLTINNYPGELVEIIKKCACDLAEKYDDYDKIYNNIVSTASGNNSSNVLSEKSGLAEVRYGYSEGVIKKFSDPKTFNAFLLETLREYLRPRLINGVVYNLTSKILHHYSCGCCNII